MQEGSKEGLLKILKGCGNLWRSAPRAGGDNLNDFRSDSEPPEGAFESFKDASEEEIKSQDSSEDFNENQLKAEWAQLGPKEIQQRLSQHIIHNYAQKENSYSKPFSFFKFIVHLLQNFDS